MLIKGKILPAGDIKLLWLSRCLKGESSDYRRVCGSFPLIKLTTRERFPNSLVPADFPPYLEGVSFINRSISLSSCLSAGEEELRIYRQ